MLGKRKSKRPLSTKHPLHLVLKSKYKNIFTPGSMSLEKLIRSQAEKYGVQLYNLALNWSHIHCLMRIKNREDYIKFIRSLTSVIAAEIRKSKSELKKIFILRPFTRILSWGRNFKRGLNYQILNQMEAHGLIIRAKRKKLKRSC